MIMTKKWKNIISELLEENETLKKTTFEAVQNIKQLQARIEEYDEMFEDYKSLSVEKALAKQSKEPWAGFSVTDTDKDGRIGLKLDWNDAFIDYLRRNGIQGSNEDDIVSTWFASLMKEMGEEITEEQAEEYRKTHNM